MTPMSNEPIKHSSSLRFQPPTPGRLRLFRTVQAVGALALFVVGGVHLEQYYVASFAVVPTIGPLFVANFIGGTVFGLVLLAPMRRSAGRGWLLLDSLVALAGMGLSVGAFAGLLVSEQTPLFGFMEHGYRLEIVLALAAEAVATVSLAVFLALVFRWTQRRGRERPARTRATGPGARPSVSEG
jgi:ABC-type uncharacterized transport system permease subunit